MRRHHPMPFGSALRAGGVSFRLWAPDAARVDLEIDVAGQYELIPMNTAADGWFECEEADARAGSRYRYCIDGTTAVPDPASRYQPEDVHGPSQVVDPLAYEWHDAAWRGRPWSESVVYEVHVGSFTRQGTFEAGGRRLEYLRDTGITVVELMPVADFPGARNWGYDGVLLYAPDSRYGTPDDLKRFIDRAHQLGLSMMLDVVYNHFGPDGNYLHVYAHDHFFNRHHQTPWGAAINYDGAGSRVVRDFVIHNALYWIEEFHFDGLRLDAIHAICDESMPDILVELADAVRNGPGRDRHVHLVLENDRNTARYLTHHGAGTRGWYDAQWNDDVHHAFHVALTGEQDGYYADYADEPLRHLGRALTEGFAFQGEVSPYRGEPRGEPSRHLPPAAFVAFLQNHDQIGNRAYGERLSTLAPPGAVRAGLALLLMAPSVPLLFMGEEFGCRQPFPFFCDFHGELAKAVTTGRRKEFARFARFGDPGAIESIPDPNAQSTFDMAVIDWHASGEPEHTAHREFVRDVLRIRAREIVPRASSLAPAAGAFRVSGSGVLELTWKIGDGGCISAIANLNDSPRTIDARSRGRVIYQTDASSPAAGTIAAWSVAWFVEPGVR